MKSTQLKASPNSLELAARRLVLVGARRNQVPAASYEEMERGQDVSSQPVVNQALAETWGWS